MSSLETKEQGCIGVAKGDPRGAMPPKIFETHSHFVLWEVVSETK